MTVIVNPTINQYDEKGNFIPFDTTEAQLSSLTKFMTSKGFMMVARKNSIGFQSFIDNKILNDQNKGRSSMSFVNAVRWHNSSRSIKYKTVKRVKLADHKGKLVVLNHLIRQTSPQQQ